MPLSDYDPIIQQAAQEWNLDPTLLKSVVAQESSGDPGAISKAGAVGLSGLMPATAQGLGVTDLSDPVQQIYAGARYLSEGLDKEGSPQGALLYYHGGPDWRSKYGAESAAYVPAVTAHYQQFSSAQPAATPATATGEAAPTKSPAQMSDSDFLKATGGGTSAPAPESDADFLARTGGSAPAAETPAALPASNPGPMSNEYGITGDPQQFNAPLTPAEQGVANTASAAVQGAKEGFGSGPLGMSPQTDQSLVNAGVFNGPNEYNPLKAINRAIVTPLATAGDLALRTGGALVGAYQHGVAQAGQEVGAPLLGRDLAALPEAFPTGDTGGGTAIPHPVAEPAAPVNPLTAAHQDILDRQAAALRARTPDVPAVNPLAATVNAPAFVPPGSNIPAPAPLRSMDDVVNALQSLPDAAARPAFAPPEMPRPTTAAAAQPTVVPPALAEGAPTAAPGPQSMGAAASRDISPPSAIEMTPAQEQAYRSTAEGRKLLEPQQPGIADPNIYVPGVIPNSAEIEQSVNTARELKSLNISAPDVSQEAKEVAAHNGDLRQQYFSGMAGSPVTTQNLRDARGAQWQQDSAATLSGATGDANTAPLVKTIQDTLNTPTGKQDTELKKYVQPLLARLQDENGNQLITDPAELIGFRQDINKLRSKASQAETPTLAHVSDELGNIVDATDDAIEKAAPGYAQQRANYADYSRQIDEQEALQEIEPKLYGANNQMQYSRFQNAMRQIVDARSSPGVNQFKSISDDKMRQAWNLRDDLRRSASAQDLARATGGSDTVQNAFDAARGAVRAGANLAAHGAILSHLGPAGNVVYNGVKSALSAGAEARALKKQTARGMQLLHPDPSTLRNPLQSD